MDKVNKRGGALVDESGWWLKAQSPTCLASAEQGSPKCTVQNSGAAKGLAENHGFSTMTQPQLCLSLWVSFSTLPSKCLYRALPNCLPS